MEPIYRLLSNTYEFFDDWAYDDEEVEKAMLHYHDHVCWLNPTETTMARRTRKMCKKFCKKHNIPKDDYGDYDCDNCPNLITRYKYQNDFIIALGNYPLYKKQGKMERT